jgi:DNA-binding LytR/AlgR family response regulator
MMGIGSAVMQRAQRVAAAATPLPAAPAPPPTLLAKLPVKLQDATILALQGEDHYVRVHTSAGSELILMRLSDAIDGMGGTPGARTHRSWWVAKVALASTRRDNGRITLVLSGGLEVPVSRGYASELKEAGWLAALPPEKP